MQPNLAYTNALFDYLYQFNQLTKFKTMTKLIRVFNLQDAVLQQHGKNVSEVITEDIEQFKAFDSTFSESYPELLKTALDSVLGSSSDMVVIDEMAEKTQAVHDAMAACNTAFRTIQFFIKKAFPGNKAVHNQFGFNDIRKARQSQSNMLKFMNDFTRVTASYKTELITAGCSEPLIDSLPQLYANLQEAETAQELFKKERGLLTQERIEKLNELYRLLTPVNEMAQIIFADDEARRARYSLPSPKSSTNSADDLIVS